MDLPFIVATLTRRGLLTPGSPIRVAAQLNALRTWGWSLAGELRQAAARDPGRTAVIDENGVELTYHDLLDRAERLARSMRAGLGVQAGDRIGVLCRNHHGLIETIVAATLLGADAVLVNTGLCRRPARHRRRGAAAAAAGARRRVRRAGPRPPRRAAPARRTRPRGAGRPARCRATCTRRSATAGSSCSPPAPPARPRAPGGRTPERLRPAGVHHRPHPAARPGPGDDRRAALPHLGVRRPAGLPSRCGPPSCCTAASTRPPRWPP